MLEQLYAVRRVQDGDTTGFAVLPESVPDAYRDELRDQVVCNEDVEVGWCRRPLTLPRDQAEALASFLSETQSQTWEARATHRPCPACGRDIWADDLDFLYPLKRDYSEWQAGCNLHDFGCGFEKWQTATPPTRETRGVPEDLRRIDPRRPLVPPVVGLARTSGSPAADQG